MKFKTLSGVIALTLLMALSMSARLFAKEAPATTPVFISFDIAGATETRCMSINSAGVVTGFSLGANGMNARGFLRARDGTITIFEVPGGSNTSPWAINSKGDVIGTFLDANEVWHPFLRHSEGEFTTLDAPGASLSPGTFGQSTYAWGINARGVITGSYLDAGYKSYGFVRSPEGAFTTIDVPGAYSTGAGDINDEGVILGGYITNFADHAFLRAPDGSFVYFDAPRGESLAGSRINSAGAVMGSVMDVNANTHGFLRTPDGTFKVFDAPGALPNPALPRRPSTRKAKLQAITKAGTQPWCMYTGSCAGLTEVSSLSIFRMRPTHCP